MARTLARTTSALFLIAALAVGGRLRANTDVPVTREDHMEMTVHAQAKTGDLERGAVILAAARALMREYADVAVAERDGYKKFLPDVPLPIEHYTNRDNAILSLASFDPARPTSIIYKRTPKGLVIVGVMYTAPNRFDAAQLDARVPLSLGTWHRHIDYCWAPAKGSDDPRFGFSGTIHDADACAAAGGRFTPRVFNWMVHVWPDETVPAKIWAVDADGAMDDQHMGAGSVFDQSTLPIAPGRLPSLTIAVGDGTRGSEIFAGNCASCHGAGGRNGPDAPRLRDSGLDAGQVAYMIRHPRAIDPASAMPDLGLTDRDVADVSAYVQSISQTRP